MYSRVTLLEIDTTRIGVDDAVELYKADVLPKLRAAEGFEGTVVLTTPEGKGMIVTVWDTEEAAAGAVAIGTEALERHVAIFRAPPGREYYRVALAEMPGVSVG
jgi:hypothetical protein